jgi:hypothetical protein
MEDDRFLGLVTRSDLLVFAVTHAKTVNRSLRMIHCHVERSEPSLDTAFALLSQK